MRKVQLYIDGIFKDAASGETFEVLNPATEEVVSVVAKASAQEVNEAVESAKRAQLAWEKLPAITRAAELRKIAQGIRERAEELTEVIMAEGGKVRALAETEVYFTADYMDYMAEWARRYEGEIIQSDRPHENIFLFKRPIGVIAGILPWNFPFFLIARKAAPALVTGNTIVLKPSTQTPTSCQIFAEICQEVGLPKGLINVVTGSGSELGEALASHPDVGMVSLTGSLHAGQAVMRAAAENITKVSLELGGKAPAIVLESANLDLAVKSIVASRVINTGQVCNCAERVYVQRSVKDEFLAKLKEAMQAVTYGNPLEETELDMGPLIEKRAQEGVDAMVKKAVEQGATLFYGGGMKEGKGYFYNPTILTSCSNDMEIVKQEIFGPVLPVIEFDTIDEVIELANDCEYGLTSSVYSDNLNDAFKVMRGLKFGETYINRENFEAMQGFHAGVRKSGIGGADGKHGLEEYLQTHVVYLETQE